MGVDLTIFPGKLITNNEFLSFSRLRVNGNYVLHDKIKQLNSYVIPELTGFFSEGYGTVTDDKYGNQIRWVYAKYLASIFDKEDKAVKAYLEALEPDHQIALYWH